MATTITYREYAEPGYQWMVRTVVDGCVTRICFASQHEAEWYVLLTALEGEDL